MKRLLPVIFGCITISAQAQNETPNNKSFDAYGNRLPNKSWVRPFKDSSVVWFKNGTVYLLNSKPGVHLLKQDNMPCIVPDPGAVITMPNAWGGKVKTPYESDSQRMPNLSRPKLKVSPSRPLIVTPEIK